MSAGAMKYCFLTCHLKGLQADLAHKEVAYFKRKENGIKRSHLDYSGHFRQQNEVRLQASFLVALRIAKDTQAHTIAERLILPNMRQKQNSLSLSNDTIQRRIADMAAEVKQQVVTEICGAMLHKFMIQLDESRRG